LKRHLLAASRFRAATVFPFNLPPVIGLGTSGGFEYQLESFEGRRSGHHGKAPPRDSSTPPIRIPVSPRVFSTYGATAPLASISTSTAKRFSRSGLTINDVFMDAAGHASVATLSTIFNLFGRTWQVNLEGRGGEAARRFRNLWNVYVRNAKGTMVPLQSIASPSHRDWPAGHHALTTTIARSPLTAVRRKAVASGTALGAMAEISSARDAAARFTASNGPARRFRSRGASGQDLGRSGNGPFVRVSVPRRPIRELDDFRSRFCCRS